MFPAVSSSFSEFHRLQAATPCSWVFRDACAGFSQESQTLEALSFLRLEGREHVAHSTDLQRLILLRMVMDAAESYSVLEKTYRNAKPVNGET